MKTNLLLIFCAIFTLNFSTTFGQNNALDFDNINDFVEVNNASSLVSSTTNMSMSCWVYPRNTSAGWPDFDGILGFRNDINADFYLLQLNSTDVEARFRNSAGGIFTAVQPGLVLNTWQHFVLTYNGTTLSVYLNGVLGVSIPANGNLVSNNVDFTLGKVNFSSGDFFFEGAIDEVGLWSKSLTAAEITCIYQEGINPTDANLELYFDLNQGVAGAANTGITSVTDRMGNIDGVLSNSSLNGNTSNWVNGVASHTQIAASICAGTTYSFGSQTLSTSGVYYNLTPLTSGCDSIAALTLTVGTITGTDIRSECPPFTWIDGNTYTSNNNTATFNIVGGAAGGCDSLVILDLTIVSQATGTDIQTKCSAYTWIDGNTYTSNNNTATFNIVGGAVNGCDSLVTLNLTVNPINGTDVQTSCGLFPWINGITYATNNNTATYSILGGAVGGCDSLVTLNLTITNQATGVDVQTSCGAFPWIDGNTYGISTNSPTFTISGGAVNGCDSVVTLNLTILNAASGIDTQTACESYTWINGNTYTSNNNSATFNIVGGAADGCDSLVTLNLTILNRANGTDVQNTCSAYTWIDGNTYTSNNNTATFNITGGAANGCDSLVSLDLTVNTINTNLSQVDNSLSTSETGASYKWLNCNDDYSVISGETNASFTASSNGDYAVEITKNTCVDTSACVTVSNVAITNTGLGSDVSIYPNPTQGKLNIDLGKTFATISVEVFSFNGQLVSSSSFENIKSIPLFLENENAGIYFIHLSDREDKTMLVKVIKK